MLAGGAGSRMGPLTEDRAKPALPFAGLYRLIDFPLSNCAHSGITDVWVLQQYQPHSLEDHLANGRPWDLDRSFGGLLVLQPFTGGEEEGFAEGNAGALWRHHRVIRDFDADAVLVLSADAVYTLDYRDVIDAHLERDADVTMVTTEIDEDVGRFGVVTVGDGGRVTSFEYPTAPRRTSAHRAAGGRRARRLGRRIGWEVHVDPTILRLGAGENGATGVEPHRPAEDARYGQRRMPAQVDLHRRREPAQVVVPVAPRHDERRLGVVHLPGDRLDPCLVGEGVEDGDGDEVSVNGSVVKASTTARSRGTAGSYRGVRTALEGLSPDATISDWPGDHDLP